MGELDEARELAEVSSRLSASYPDVPLATVQDIVSAAWAQFAGRPIRDFVPVLAERSANDALRQMPTED